MLTGSDFPCPPPPPEAPQPPADLSDRAALAAWLSEMGARLTLSKGLTRDGEALARAGEMLTAPTMWWLADDEEYSHDDPEEFLEPGEYATGHVLHLTCAARCPDEFYTVVGDLEADESQSLRPSTVAEVEAYIAGLKDRDKYLRGKAEKALERMKAGGR